MKFVEIFALAVLSSCLLYSVRSDDDDEYDLSENALRAMLKKRFEREEMESLLKRDMEGQHGNHKRAIFSCKELNQKCSMVTRCCGSLQCYWENGLSVTKTGVCVDCVKQGQLCQRDTQCCSGLVCQKGKFGYTDGICDAKRPSGGACHENDQCQTNNCNITPWQLVSRVEGTCA